MTLHRGSAGETVRAVQVALTRRGFGPLRADGVCGPTTEAALAAASRAIGRPVDTAADVLSHNRPEVP